MSEPPNLVALGAVGRPHGLRGEVRVHRYNPESLLLLELDRIWARSPEGVLRELRVESAKPHGDLLRLRFEGMSRREDAEAIKGSELLIPRESLPPTEEDEVYLVDLIGLEAVSPEGAHLGNVASVIPYPSVDCLLVEAAEGAREIPFLDPYVGEIDIEAGRVVISHIEDFDLRPAKRR